MSRQKNPLRLMLNFNCKPIFVEQLLLCGLNKVTWSFYFKLLHFFTKIDVIFIYLINLSLLQINLKGGALLIYIVTNRPLCKTTKQLCSIAAPLSTLKLQLLLFIYLTFLFNFVFKLLFKFI